MVIRHFTYKVHNSAVILVVAYLKQYELLSHGQCHCVPGRFA